MSKIVVEDVLILKKKKLASDCFSISMAPFSKVKSIRPGQFVHMQIPNCSLFFRRAFSVYSVNTEEKSLEILFKVFGRGTKIMASLKKGDKLGLLGPLGNSFRKPKRNELAALIAGGVGFPPIYYFGKHLLDKGYDPDKLFFFYGGRGKSDLIELARLKKLGIKTILTTEDGSLGKKGLITSPLEEWITGSKNKKVIYSCGPEGMLKAIDQLALKYNIQGQISLEAPMPCGIGICLGCIKPLRSGGNTRVCREGPVFDIGEVLL
ncbi:MAG: dihydroorotate dehydrogenase electron transfer subunit [candidate division Zixibacteria bacterium]|nr:dihydroorotate dehydrogenase electron transfer subunit [candidate division Zixibacteria bacterium]